MANGPAEGAVAKEGQQQEDGQQAPANEKAVSDQLSAAQKKLKQLMEVNRKLHTALAEKKLHAVDLKKANDTLMRKLEAREFEEVGRHKQLQDLQQKLLVEQTSQQSETLTLQKSVMTLEERIVNLNDDNLQLNNQHKENKHLISEQQNTMKLLQRRAKELSRHIEFMTGHLGGTEGQFMQVESYGLPEDAVYTPAPAEQKVVERPRTMSDFRKLPGLNLEKLLGADATDVMNLGRTAAGRVDSRGASPESQQPRSAAGGDRRQMERRQSQKSSSSSKRSGSGRDKRSSSSGQGQELGPNTGSTGSRPGSGTANRSTAGSIPSIGSDE